jgi:DNA-binding NarL/FixJ family response regulator
MPKNNRISIILVDDHAILRHGLKQSLTQDENFIIIKETDNGRDAVKLVDKYCPDVVIMDINMPELNGIESTKQILLNNPDIKIIALSMHCDQIHVMRMINAGAKGFLLKTCSFDELRKAIYKVDSGDNYLCQEALNIVMESNLNPEFNATESPLSRLTIREKEVLQLIAEGNKSIEISEKLNISKRTIDIHRSNLMSKLKISNIPDLIRLSIKEKIIEL